MYWEIGFFIALLFFGGLINTVSNASTDSRTNQGATRSGYHQEY